VNKDYQYQIMGKLLVSRRTKILVRRDTNNLPII